MKGHVLSSSNKDGSNPQDVSATLFDGAKPDKNVFQENGLNNPKAHYGHRDERPTMNGKYEPDRPTGTKYFGKVFPNIPIGTFADIHLVVPGQDHRQVQQERTDHGMSYSRTPGA